MVEQAEVWFIVVATSDVELQVRMLRKDFQQHIKTFLELAAAGVVEEIPPRRDGPLRNVPTHLAQTVIVEWKLRCRTKLGPGVQNALVAEAKHGVSPGREWPIFGVDAT